ncbi:hypothetical protein FOA52_002136 [Chlamydomonas sp. UWO 241]|nr:hypothetical protein FOA52_002136 [Chlamydomonas sp. UWO 241]
MQSSAERRLEVVTRQLTSGAHDPSGAACSQPCSGSSSCCAKQLAGQVAIITGAGKGIGEAAAKLLASQGAAIVVCDLDAAAAETVVGAITAAGGRAYAVTADVTAPESAQRIVDGALSQFGGIDIIVNNAGFTWDAVIHKMTLEQWAVMLEVHCTAPFRLVQAAAPHLRAAAKREAESEGRPRPRSIVNISSTSGTHGNAGQANYATAKAGVLGLTKSIAKEWGPLNIRCNAIAYGLIDTRLTRAKEGGESISVGGRQVPLGIPGANKYWAGMKSAIPLQRLGTVDDAAGAVMALVSPWTAYMTGQCVEVNGGAFM